MLDDIISERLSIFPGSFPKPRPIFKKSDNFSGGFSTYIRPPIPIYQIKCQNDFNAEQNSKAETGIKKFYRVPGNNANKERTAIFQPDASTDFLLSKYRESYVYTKPRMRKVNKKQLAKTVQLLKRNAEFDLQKEIKISLSKVSVHPVANKPNMSDDPKLKTRKKRQITANSTASSKMKAESNNLIQTIRVDKLKENVHVKEGSTRSAYVLRSAPVMSIGNSLLSRLPTERGNQERAFKNDNEEVKEILSRKKGNYTIVTLKKNAYKEEVAVDAKCKKMEKNYPCHRMRIEGNSTNPMLKTNKVQSDDAINNFSDSKSYSLRQPSRTQSTKSEEVVQNRVLPTNPGYKSTLFSPNLPNGESSPTTPVRIISKSRSTKLNQIKEERFLMLPKITPSFSIGLTKNHKKYCHTDANCPVRYGDSDSAFVRLRQLYNMNI